MEARIARLESDVEYIKRDVAGLKEDFRLLRIDMTDLKVAFARLDERVKALPSKGFIVATMMSIVTLGTAVLLFADKLKALVGVAH